MQSIRGNRSQRPCRRSPSQSQCHLPSSRTRVETLAVGSTRQGTAGHAVSPQDSAFCARSASSGMTAACCSREWLPPCPNEVPSHWRNLFRLHRRAQPLECVVISENHAHRKWRHLHVVSQDPRCAAPSVSKVLTNLEMTRASEPFHGTHNCVCGHDVPRPSATERGSLPMPCATCSDKSAVLLPSFQALAPDAKAQKQAVVAVILQAPARQR